MPRIRQKDDEENVVGDDRSKESTRPVLGWAEVQSISSAQPRAMPIAFNTWKTRLARLRSTRIIEAQYAAVD